MRAKLKLRIFAPLFICFLSAAISCSSEDAGPPDTTAQRFAGSACYGSNIGPDDRDGRCTGNAGCTEKSILCGQCACVLCADEYCVSRICDDGGPGCFVDDWIDDVEDATSDTDASSDSDTSPDADASYDGPPDTSAQRFVDTACYGRNFTADDKGGRCTGNVGCADLPDICGSCYCDLCADEYCIAHECNDGGNPECPGGFEPGDAG